MFPIITLPDKCRKCYSCVRSCPVKAIKVDKKYTEIIHERCIGCGNCLNNCPQKAKIVTDKVSATEKLLKSSDPAIAVLGCSFPSYFHTASPGQIVTALKKLGFAEVHEGALGAELIAKPYSEMFKNNQSPMISSHCPAVVDLIERHFPSLVPSLVPIVSPMIAMGRFLRKIHNGHVNIVYITSCIAGKFDKDAAGNEKWIDTVLTYREAEAMLRGRNITPAALKESCFNGYASALGRIFSITGGPMKLFGIPSDPTETETVSAEGESNVMALIRDLATGKITPKFADLRFCHDGCIGGPGSNRTLTGFYKRKLVISHFRNRLKPCDNPELSADVSDIDFSRSFENRHVVLSAPSSQEIKRVLHSTSKFTSKDELNCKACGYNSCREYAVAVTQGLADLDMCLPFNLKQLSDDHDILIQKYELVKRELKEAFEDQLIVGGDLKTAEVLQLIKQVAPTPTTVLIRGESGCGKELTARAIHSSSTRNDKPLVTLNCTALVDSLLESELFGHRRGSFTGAISDKKGLFEAADGGTIFLDEIGDISPKLQAELLRVLDLGEVRPVGSTSSKKVNVRLIAATNKNLETGLKEGWFREDLYYRLNVFSITMPPLRERQGSIPSLALHFLEKANRKLKKNLQGIEERALKAMERYPWPGNIRELQNVIERAAVLTHSEVITLGNLPLVFAENYADKSEDILDLKSFKSEREPHIMKVEKKLIQRYLNEAKGNISKAANLANIPRRSFYRLLDRHGLKKGLNEG